MSESPDDIKKKIMEWLIEEYPLAKVEIKHNSKVYFQIWLINKKGDYVFIPILISLHKEVDDRIIIEFYWQMTDDYIRYISALKPEAKAKFQKELNQGFLLMHLNLKIEPNLQNIQRIGVQDQIILDGLTKHALINSLLRIIAGHGFILSLFDMIHDQGFNPYQP